MSYFVVDVESDGPIPNKYSMVCFGAVKVISDLSLTFYGKTKPISEIWQADSLAISGFSRNEHLNFNDPKQVMLAFKEWILSNSVGNPIMISDNIAYDWQWINYYFHYFLGENPFGYSGRRIGDLFSGMKMQTQASWKHLIKTPHDHNPVNDAIGVAEALISMKEMGLKIKLD